MPLNNLYRKDNPVISTYPFDEIEDGTGIVKFNLCRHKTSAGSTYSLTKTTMYPDDGTVAMATATAIDAFEVIFNLPKIIVGTAYISIGCRYSTGGGGNATLTPVLEKESGGSDTQLATAVSKTMAGGVGGYNYHRVNIPLAISQTSFAKDDKLKLKLTANFDAGTFEIFCDPANTGVSTSPSISSVFVPFKIINS